jgi:hypothetical protein
MGIIRPSTKKIQPPWNNGAPNMGDLGPSKKTRSLPTWNSTLPSNLGLYTRKFGLCKNKYDFSMKMAPPHKKIDPWKNGIRPPHQGLNLYKRTRPPKDELGYHKKEISATR